jgi:hypothetical protein
LIISEGTVKNHISNILSRLELRDRTQIALYARDHGLLSDAIEPDRDRRSTPAARSPLTERETS